MWPISMISTLTRGFADLTFPQRCFACEEPTDRPLCEACRAIQTARDGPRCICCDGCLPVEAPAHRCGRCLDRRPAFERVFGIFAYEEVTADMMRAAKYGKRPALLAEMVRWLPQHLPAELIADPPNCVIPVALHWRRVDQRGFHPPLIVGKAVSKALGVPLARRLLRRNRHTPEQAGLDEVGRRRNMRGAFQVRGRPPSDVLLVDDVMTTGATLNAASRSLRRAGALRVRGLTLAYVDRSF